MATNIHFEARRRQMFLDRASKARKEMAFPQKSDVATHPEAGPKPDTVMCTDQGQFYQTRTPGRNDLVFEKVVHDPNFYYRSSKARGLDPPLHVNDIYSVMYPGATVRVDTAKPKSELPRFRVNKDGHTNRYRNRQHLKPHCDKVYTVLYPGKGNADYTDNPLRTFRRENSFADAYQINKKVNGEFRMQCSARARIET